MDSRGRRGEQARAAAAAASRPGRGGSAVGPGVGAAARVAAAVGPGRWGRGGHGLRRRVRTDPVGPRLGGLLRLLAVRAGRAAGRGAETEELPVSESARGHRRG